VFASRSKSLLFPSCPFVFGEGETDTTQIKSILLVSCKDSYVIVDCLGTYFFCPCVMSCKRDCHDAAPARPNLALPGLRRSWRQNKTWLSRREHPHHYPCSFLLFAFSPCSKTEHSSHHHKTRPNSGVRCRPPLPFIQHTQLTSCLPNPNFTFVSIRSTVDSACCHLAAAPPTLVHPLTISGPRLLATFLVSKMNSANVEKLEAAEKSTSLLLPTHNDNRPTGTKAEDDENNMFKKHHFFLTLLLVTLLTLGLVSAASNNARQPAALAVSEEQAKFQDLLNSVEPGCLHEVLHQFMGSKYKHGVYQEDKTAMEALHQSNAEAAHSLIELAKRQGGTSSSNGSATTTTVPDSTTTTSVPVTSTAPPTTLPPSSSSTVPVPVPPTSSIAQTTPQPTSSITTVIETSTASPSGSTTAPTSAPSSTTGTFQGGPAAYPFAPPPPLVSSSSYGPIQNTTYLPYSFAPPSLPAPSTAAYTVQNSSVSVSTTPPSYGAAASASSVQNSSVSEIVPLSSYGVPLTTMAQNSSSYSPAALSSSSALPQNTSSALSVPSYDSSSAYSVQTSSCTSATATLYTPTSTMYNTSSSANCSATMSSTVPPSSFPTLTPAQNCSNSSVPSISNSTLPVSGFNNYSGVASTSGPPPSSHGSSSSTPSQSSSSGHLGYTSFSSSVQFSPLGQASNTSLGSTSSTRSSSFESSLTTSRSITQQVVYTTTGANGAQETVTRTTIVPADQAETGGGSGTGTNTATASLQSNGVGSDKSIGLNLVLGALGLIVAGTL
jgi:hypothetical protein